MLVSTEGVAVFAAKPTQLSVIAADVKTGVNDSDGAIAHLSSATAVRIMETGSGWTLVTREGKRISDFRDNAIVRLRSS